MSFVLNVNVLRKKHWNKSLAGGFKCLGCWVCGQGLKQALKWPIMVRIGSCFMSPLSMMLGSVQTRNRFWSKCFHHNLFSSNLCIQVIPVCTELRTLCTQHILPHALTHITFSPGKLWKCWIISLGQLDVFCDLLLDSYCKARLQPRGWFQPTKSEFLKTPDSASAFERVPCLSNQVS